MKTPYDLTTKMFPRKLDGTYEDMDIYISCQHDMKIFYYGRNTLQAYIPSLIRGHNIIKAINENFGQDKIFDIEETDAEVLFKFKTKDANDVIPLLKPKTSGANISPFSSKNLPKNKDYKIPDEDLVKYKSIVSKIPKERILNITHMTNRFLKTLVTKRNTWENIKADMSMKGLKGKEYIHSIGKWEDYIKYLQKGLEDEY